MRARADAGGRCRRSGSAGAPGAGTSCRRPGRALLDTASASLAAARPHSAEAARLLETAPHALCPSGRRHAVAILGQSLDGFIATCDGQSRYINGEATVHLHRLRARATPC
ncbi:MAG: hypothetical protein U1E17_04695 [Geminicoccaceae bacterium]